MAKFRYRINGGAWTETDTALPFTVPGATAADSVDGEAIGTTVSLPALDVPATIGDQQLYIDGVYQAYLSPWGAASAGYSRPADYATSMTINTDSFPADSSINWRWNPEAAPMGRVRAYHYGGYGNPAYADGLPVDPIQVNDIETLYIRQDWDATGSDNFSQLTELFLLSDPSDHSTKVAEIGWFTKAHSSAAAWAAAGEFIGAITDAFGVQWTVRRQASGVANNFFMIIPTDGVTRKVATIDARQMLDFLIANEQLTGDEYCPGYMVGFEIVDEGGEGSFDLSYSGQFSGVVPKRLQLIDSNNLFVIEPAPFGQALSYKVIRNQGSNDAGPEHETWRKARTSLLATTTSSPTASGLTWMIASDGSQSYALAMANDTFGGDVHGGEVVLTEQWQWMAGSTWTDFDPTTSQPEADAYRVQRTSRVTWPLGAIVDVDYTLTFAATGGFETVFTLTSADSIKPNLAYAPMAMVQNTFTQCEYIDGGTPVTVDLTAGTTTADGKETTLPVGLRALRLIDPGSRYFVDIAFTAPTLKRLYVLNSVNFSKLYPVLPDGPVGTFAVTQSIKYGRLPAPAGAPFETIVDEFASGTGGTPAGWTKRLPTGAITMTSTFNGTEWYTAATDTTIHRWDRPLAGMSDDGATVYRYTLDYTAGAANTASQFYILKDANVGTSADNIIVGPINLNSNSESASVTGTFTVPAGSSPCAMIAPTALVGRNCRHKTLIVNEEP